MYVILLWCLLISLVFLYDYVQKHSSSWKKLSKFPGDNTFPLIGNSLQLGFNSDEVTHKLLALWNKHGKQNFRFTVGSEQWILLTNPDDVGTALNQITELSKPLERNAGMKLFFGNSLSSSDGEKWKSTRKFMAPSFNFTTLEKRVEDANKVCERLFTILDSYDGKGPVDLYRYVRPFMFDVLSTALMGVETNFLADPGHPYFEASGKVVNIVTQIFFSHWRNIRALFVLTPMYRDISQIKKMMRLTCGRIIDERRKKLNQLREEARNNNKNIDVNIESTIEKELSDNACLLDKFLLSETSNGEINSDKISDEIIQIYFTGHYTTTLLISHTLYCLAKYPEIQRKVLEEQESIFSNNQHKKPTSQELSQMTYLEAVIKESIRVIPTVTKIGRQLHKDLTFKDGRIAPAGTTLLVFYEALYQNPEVFPEPEKYRPERHLQSLHTFSLIPFGAGPRICIGFRFAWLAMKTLLSNILRTYEVLPGGPNLEPQFVNRITTESKNGVHLRFKKRKYC